MFKVLMFGDREWSPVELIRAELMRVLEGTALEEDGPPHGARDVLVIEGGQRGVDETSKVVAHSLGVHVAEVRALWHYYHRAAGPIRNGVMESLMPDLGIGFHPNIAESKGTADMLKKLRVAGVPVVLRSETVRTFFPTAGVQTALGEALDGRR